MVNRSVSGCFIVFGDRGPIMGKAAGHRAVGVVAIPRPQSEVPGIADRSEQVGLVELTLP